MKKNTTKKKKQQKKRKQNKKTKTKQQQSPAILELCLRETVAGKSPGYLDFIVVEKFPPFLKRFFCPDTNEKPAFSSSPV